MTADLAREDEIVALFATAHKTFGRLDVERPEDYIMAAEDVAKLAVLMWLHYRRK